ncbi:Protein-S-isoprenylcysteine O-methyltransferase [Entamoeba marina]
MICIGPHTPTSFEKRIDVMVITGIIMGILIGFGIGMIYAGTSFVNFVLFVIVFLVFHIFEFLYNAIFQTKTVSFSSFLLTHSYDFLIALGLALLEYWIEMLLFPSLKLNPYIYLPAFVFCIIFQTIRTISMFYAATNFNHMIETKVRASHQLVDDFIYKYLRHPSYFGWFYWSVFTQILLINPICIVLYTIASWKFFADRIPYEEATLFVQFDKSYCRYMDKTIIGIPFIKSTNPPDLQLIEE